MFMQSPGRCLLFLEKSSKVFALPVLFRKRCTVTGKVPTIYLKVPAPPVLLRRTTMFVYKLPIRLLSKFWLTANVPHASLFSDFFKAAAFSAFQ